MSAHVEFGGSTAGRTVQCPGWHTFRKLVPPGGSSEAAELGTALHTVMEEIMGLEEGSNAALAGYLTHLLEREVNGIKITPALIDDKVIPAYNALNMLFATYDVGLYEAEVAVRMMVDTGGTADVLAISADGKTAICADFKFGDGVMVYPDDNPQAMFYYAAAETTEPWADDLNDVETVVLAIIQPTDRNDDPTLKVWETTPKHIAAFVGRYVAQRAKALSAMDAFDKSAELPDESIVQAGEYCKFCPAMAICPRKTGLYEQAVRMDTTMLGELGKALTLTYEIEEWIDSVRKLAHTQMDRGDQVPGFKLVNKRATRRWRDTDAIEAALKKQRKVKFDESHATTLLTPPALEKVFKHKGVDFEKFGEYIESHSSGTTIATEDDKRATAVSLLALQALAARTA